MTLITHFMRRSRVNEFSIERLYEDIRATLPDDCRVKVWTCRNFSEGVWRRLQDVWLARTRQGEVNHVTGDVHYLTFLLDPRRTVLTIHDLVMLGRPRGVRRGILWFFWYWLPVHRSRLVIAISESTRRALLESVRCHPAKVRVIYNNVSDEFQPVPRIFNAQLPRILHIGTTCNKNLKRVAEALKGIRCRLVVVGALSHGQREALREHDITYENLIGLSREGIVAQYAAADLVLFASTYEGFGLPIVEANAVGRPVVTSRIWSMPEVAGEAACLIDPFDASSIRAGVLRVINDTAYRDDLVARGLENVKRFKASRIAEQYASLYREIGEETRQRTLRFTLAPRI